MTRKRRRGIIEKRRRDRINHSLSELRRLVPSAFEKQGSAKLEKAEILQLTVDHLKMLHAKGKIGNNSAPIPVRLLISSVFRARRTGRIGLRSAQVRHGLPQHRIPRVRRRGGPLPRLGRRDGRPRSASSPPHVPPAVLCRPARAEQRQWQRGHDGQVGRQQWQQRPGLSSWTPCNAVVIHASRSFIRFRSNEQLAVPSATGGHAADPDRLQQLRQHARRVRIGPAVARLAIRRTAGHVRRLRNDGQFVRPAFGHAPSPAPPPRPPPRTHNDHSAAGPARPPPSPSGSGSLSARQPPSVPVFGRSKRQLRHFGRQSSQTLPALGCRARLLMRIASGGFCTETITTKC